MNYSKYMAYTRYRTTFTDFCR